MICTGTLINMSAIIFGGLIGIIGKNFFALRYQEILMKTTGLCVIFIGISGALEKMLVVEDGRLSGGGTMVLIGSFTLGALVGEFFNFELKMEQFGEWLKRKSGNSGDTSFVNAFLTASFTVSIGAMAIVGSLQEGMQGDYSTLVTKAILDFLIILIMSASLGKGCMFSAIPVGILQGSVTILARWIAPFMTDLALEYISMTGSILIFCVGINLVWKQTFKVANMLPTVLFAAIIGMLGL